MDKREKILNILTDGKWRKGGLFVGNPSLTNIADAILEAVAPDEPAEPKRDWLKVDEKTPAGTLCWAGKEHARVELLREYRKDDPTGFEYWYKTLNSSMYAERFLGIHLLDNPGLDAPPCDGLVFLVFTSQEVEVGHAEVYDWDFHCALPHIIQWAPVKWVDGKLVVDIERLRGES